MAATLLHRNISFLTAGQGHSEDQGGHVCSDPCCGLTSYQGRKEEGSGEGAWGGVSLSWLKITRPVSA